MRLALIPRISPLGFTAWLHKSLYQHKESKSTVAETHCQEGRNVSCKLMLPPVYVEIQLIGKAVPVGYLLKRWEGSRDHQGQWHPLDMYLGDKNQCWSCHAPHCNCWHLAREQLKLLLKKLFPKNLSCKYTIKLLGLGVGFAD